jgi:hypothetical protein
MLYSEIIAVCSKIHTKHINTLCGHNVELLNVKPGGTHSNHWSQSINISYGLWCFLYAVIILFFVLRQRGAVNTTCWWQVMHPVMPDVILCPFWLTDTRNPTLKAHCHVAVRVCLTCTAVCCSCCWLCNCPKSRHTLCFITPTIGEPSPTLYNI